MKIQKKLSQNSKFQNSEDTSKNILASPFSKKNSKDNMIDLSKLNGTGPDGRIIKRDIEI